MKSATLVLCPLSVEFKIVKTALESLGLSGQVEPMGPIQVIDYKEANLKLALGGHGKVQFAVHTRYLLDHIGNINKVICLGGAGSLRPEVQAPDVLIGTEIVEHDFRLGFIKKPLPRFECDKNLLSKASKISSGDDFKVHFGGIASGDEDILSQERAKSVSESTGALVVAWEGAGGARACRLSNTPYIEIRAIVDNANEDAALDFANQIEQSLAHATKVLMDLLNTN